MRVVRLDDVRVRAHAALEPVAAEHRVDGVLRVDRHTARLRLQLGRQGDRGDLGVESGAVEVRDRDALVALGGRDDAVQRRLEVPVRRDLEQLADIDDEGARHGRGVDPLAVLLDLQAGRAQTRFYIELENWLSSMTDLGSDVVAHGAGEGTSEEIKVLSEKLQRLAQDGGSTQRTTAAMASLAEGIQGLVKNMRNEQQMLRDWIEAQQEEAKKMRQTLDKLGDKLGDKTGDK